MITFYTIAAGIIVVLFFLAYFKSSPAKRRWDSKIPTTIDFTDIPKTK